jgi:uncharacterized protein (TIGR03437 family)
MRRLACYLEESLSSYRLLFLGLIPLLSGLVSAQSLFVKPVKVLGDPNFIGTAANPLLFDSNGPNVVEGRELQNPQGIAIDTSVNPPLIYIADTFNNRVLGFQYNTQLTPGAFADLVLGQPDRFTNIAEGPGTSLTTGLSLPTGLAVDSSGNLYVADTGDNRILRYPKPFSQPAGYQFPDLIVGQKSFTTGSANSGGIGPATLQLNNGTYLGRTGITIDASGNLWVADIGNNRVLRFPAAVLAAGLNGPSADLAVGQANLISSVATQSRTSQLGLNHPTSVSFDPSGNMFVADSLGRALVYAPPISVNASAVRFLGVDPSNPANSASQITANNPQSVISTANNVILADAGFNRVFIYSAASGFPPVTSQLSPSAIQVVGQSNYLSTLANDGNVDASSISLNGPVDLAATSAELFVVDSTNNRVIVFPAVPSGFSQTASRVIGQLNFPYQSPNLIEGKEFNLSASSASGASGSAVLDNSATPPHLYVADTQNNRILGFKSFQTVQTGQVADLVIGQPDFFRSIVNYPSGSATTPNAQGLNSPTSLAVDSAGNLYVADTQNSRILRFPAPFASGKTAGESADLVIGQTDFTSIVTDATIRTLSAPAGIAFTQDGGNVAKPNSGWLVVSDASQNRVLMFPKPFSNGVNASVVLGQDNFDTTNAGNTSASLSSPRGVAVDPNDRILVTDFGNARVQIFDVAANLTYGAAATLALTNGLKQPVAIGMGPNGDFWVADPSQNHLLHFPSVSQLPLNSYNSNATQPAVSPRSAFVDPFNNLLITDGIDRVLYYAPQVSIVNAANFLVGRALAAGTFAAIFPTIATNPLAPGTQTQIATTLPFPTTLGDTQVIVNGTPSALYFVSQGQINLPLSLGLPTGGTVDVQVVRQSTGQIYGATSMALSSASPALFTDGSTATGQVAAINAVDGSVNSATNPVIRGQFVELYGTGQGPVPNPPPDGQASSGPVPTLATPQVLLGNPGTGAFIPSANITYSGLAPTLVDVWQINIQIPTTAQSGTNVPITVFMNNIPNTNPNNPTEIVTTISIK